MLKDTYSKFKFNPENKIKANINTFVDIYYHYYYITNNK